MRIDLVFPLCDGILSTTNIQTVKLEGSSRRYEKSTAFICLVYDKTNEQVPATKKDVVKPDTLSGVDYLDGVPIVNGVAEFKIKILALSSQHDNRNFRFQVCIMFPDKKKEILHSCSFRTLSKLTRKRKLNVETDVEAYVYDDLFEFANSYDINDIYEWNECTTLQMKQEEMHNKQHDIHYKQKHILDKLQQVNRLQIKELTEVDKQNEIYMYQQEIKCLLQEVDDLQSRVLELRNQVYGTCVLSPLSD